MTQVANENSTPAEISSLHQWLTHLGMHQKLSPVSKWLMLWLVEFLGTAEKVYYPGTQRMADICGISYVTMWRAEQQLIKLNFIDLKEVTNGHFTLTRVKQLRLNAEETACYHEVKGTLTGSRKPKVPRKNRNGEIVRVPAADPPLPSPEGMIETPIPTHEEIVLQANSPASDADVPAPEKQESDMSQTAEESKKGKSRKLTEEEKIQICTDFTEMTNYLLYGAEGVGKRAFSGLKPASSNWRQFGGTKDDPKCEQWKVPHFMGFWWYRVSWWRATKAIPVSLPAWNRMAGDFRNLLMQMPASRLYQYMDFVVNNFDLIKHSVGRAGTDLVLNETTLMNSMVRSTADSLMSLGRFELGERYKQMNNPQQFYNKR